VNAAVLICQLSFFSLIGGFIFLRRQQLGFEPSRTPSALRHVKKPSG
jgi:hypothetical protein